MSFLRVHDVVCAQFLKIQVTAFCKPAVADVMHIASEKFLISVSSPLELLMTYHVKDLSKDSLGKGIQSHVSTLRSRGF
jgi:hypothetical protein